MKAKGGYEVLKVVRGGDDALDFSRNELKGCKRDRRRWGCADKICTTPAIKCRCAAVAMDASDESANALKWAEAVHVHVGPDDLVRVRNRRRNHLGESRGDHQIECRDFVELHSPSRGEFDLD